MPPVMHAQPLVLGTLEDGREQVTRDEEEQEPVVHARVPVRVEDAEQDQARRARDGEADAQRAQRLLGGARVARQPARVPEVALGEDGEVEGDGRNDVAGDEERF